jgi:spore coat protein U-like protein
MFRNSIVPITAGVMLALAGSAQAAGTKTATFAVNATVASNCFITTTPLLFGDFNGTADIASNATLVVRCSKNAPFQIALNAGTTPGATLLQRLLAGPGGDTLQYNLYTAAGFGTIWGNNAGGTGWVTGVGAGLGVANQATLDVFGNLPNNAANQSAGVGAYSDLVTATITY